MKRGIKIHVDDVADNICLFPTWRCLPIGVRDGLVMVWPGTCVPNAELPASFQPPDGYTVHAELIIEVRRCRFTLSNPR
jgi:hypothetical protein